MSGSRTLPPEAVARFHENGYLGPFRALSESEAKEYRRRIETDIIDGEDDRERADTLHKLNLRHRDDEYVFDLCTHDSITAKMSDIYGPNLLLWESRVWLKPPGALEVPWHQHYHHLPVEPQVSLTAWIALTEATVDNGCLELIPGTHTDPIPQVDAPDDVAFNEMADPDEFDADDVETIEMEPGEVLLFSERVLHRSYPNTTDGRRIAVTSRAVPPYVNVNEDVYIDDEDFRSVMLMTGENTRQLNQLLEPPTSE